nr:hypothetical protein Iba_scaffold489CG0090 [Ipomoea batatas]
MKNKLLHQLDHHRCSLSPLWQKWSLIIEGKGGGELAKLICCPAAMADMRESSPANTAPATIAANRLELAPDGGDNVGGVGVESPKSTGHGRASEILEHVELY